MTKSVSAGEYAAPPAQGPQMSEILRHDAREHHVVVEHLAVAGERIDALLHAGAAGVVDEDERAAGLQRSRHRVGDFQRVDFARRAAQHGEVLARQMNESAVDRRRRR